MKDRIYKQISVTLDKSNISKIDDKGNLFINGLAFSGNSVQQYDYVLGIDLTNAKTAKKRTDLLWMHNTYDLPVGSADVRIDNEINITNGEIYNSDNIDNAKGIIDLFNNHHALQLSIGISGNVLWLEKRETRIINGISQTIDAIMQDITLEELSLVNLGADSNSFALKMSKVAGFSKKDVALFTNEKDDNMTIERIRELEAQLAESSGRVAELENSISSINIELSLLKDEKNILEVSLSDEKKAKEQLETSNLELSKSIELRKVKDIFGDIELNDSTLKLMVAASDEDRVEFAKQLQLIKTRANAKTVVEGGDSNSNDDYICI